MSSDLGFAHRFVPSPSGSEGLVLLLLHGTGGTEEDLLPMGRSLLPGAALLSLRGQVLEGTAPRFFRRLAEGVFDVEDLKFRTHELAGFVESAADEYGFDGSKVVALGYSNGANIAASLMLLRPEVLAGAALLHPMVPLVPKALPSLNGRPVFIGAGRRDPLVAPEETERLVDLLHSCGAPVEVHWQDNGHGITQDELAAARAWLQRVSDAL